ncbi:MAG: hypothetical protein ACQR33_04770 [Candidatus Saccharibacteria bacterium]
MSEILANVPHPVTILADESCDFDGLTYGAPETREVPRAEATITDLGVIACDGLEVPVRTVDYRRTTRLPAPTPGVMRIVSQITVLAAYNEGRPTSDLLVPFGFQCVPGKPIGARGLALPEFAEPRTHDSGAMPSFITRLKNTGGRYEALYPQSYDVAFAREKKTIATVFEPASPSEQLDIVYEKNKLDELLTEQYGVPILRTRVSHVTGLENVEPGVLGIVEPRILLALGGAVMANDSYVGVMIGDEVRSADGPSKGSVVGGRSLLIPPIGGALRPRI